MSEQVEFAPVIPITGNAQDYFFRGNDFDHAAARQLVLSCLPANQFVRRKQIIEDVLNAHLRLGGHRGKINPVSPVKKALSDFHAAGLVVSKEKGYYAIATAEIAKQYRTKKKKRGFRFKRDLVTDKTVGVGSQYVYVYLNPNDRLLAQYEGRLFFECKTGFSTREEPKERVFEQIGTALSRFPVIGLAIKTPDAEKLEADIHRVLELAHCVYEDRCGSEWFMTSPAMVEEIWLEITRGKPIAEITPMILQMKQMKPETKKASLASRLFGSSKPEVGMRL